MDIQFECEQCITYRKKILQLEKQIKKLTLKKESINISERLDLSQSRIDNLIDQYYTLDTFNEGYKGIISFLYSHVVRIEKKVAYKCTDLEKNIFEYKNNLGEVCTDVKCKLLIDSIYKPLLVKVNIIYKSLLNKIHESYEIDLNRYIQEEDEKKLDENEKIVNTVDLKINKVVAKFSEIKKCLSKNRKIIYESLSELLFLYED